MSNNQKLASSLQPTAVWNIFASLSDVPRPSKKEARVQQWALDFAKQHGFDATHEDVGNVIIRVPATKGRENAPTVVIQGHLDMVAEKNAGTQHDFENDPIELMLDKDPRDGTSIVRAKGTTLGADNGIGVALALAAATEKDVTHGPLEILLTCDEEAGMTGAKAVTPKSITGRTLINLDSEEDHALYIGCAGGADTTLRWELPLSRVDENTSCVAISVTGLTGGHSGCDIHLNRGNAIKLAARVIATAQLENYRLISFDGGSMRNAIPREAKCVLAVSAKDRETLQKAAKEVQEAALRAGEAKARIQIETAQAATGAAATDDSKKIIHCALALPSSVLALVPTIPGLVQTSNNVSTIASKQANDKLAITLGCLTRSSAMDDTRSVVQQIRTIGTLTGATVDAGNAYPGWQPNADSKLLKTCAKVYEDCFGHKPTVTAIHAGLECGIIGERVGGDMDMISFGPRIEGAHSPDERVYPDSVAKIWTYLKAVLKELAV
ncbi:MAG: aminoacyl-histidine dipeptidase [Phycisphaerae bacterium]